MKKEQSASAFVTYCFEGGETFSIQLIGSSSDAGMKIGEMQDFLIQAEGECFAEEHIRRETLAAFFWFIGTYEDALRRLS